MVSPGTPDFFAATRWSLVRRASGRDEGAKTALTELCVIYYRPVHRFVVHWCGDEETARDLTQDFFAQLLSQPRLESADPGRGKFRSYLLGAVKHFLNDGVRRVQTKKRGGGIEHVCLGSADDDSGIGAGLADINALPPDVEFDRQWALTVLERALESLEVAMAQEGKGSQFEVLKPWLAGTPGETTLSQTASRLGVSESALRVALHRLRQRFRDHVRLEVTQTLDPLVDVNEELRHLRQILAS